MSEEPVRHVLVVADQDVPGVWPAAYDQVCVQVAHHGATTYQGGFDLGRNAQRWIKAFGPERVAVWATVGPQDTEDLASLIAATTPQVPYVLLFVAGAVSRPWTAQAVERITHGFLEAMPDVPLGYSVDASPENCRAYGIDIDLWNRHTSLAVPQLSGLPVGTDLEALLTPFGHPHPLLSPTADPSWIPTAEAALGRFSAVFWWRCGLQGHELWPTQLRGAPLASGVRPLQSDPLRPDHRGRLPQGRFIAWDGTHWALTDMLHSRRLALVNAERLAQAGVPVAYWPEVHMLTVDLT